MEVQISDPILEAKIGAAEIRIEFLKKSKRSFHFHLLLNSIALIIVVTFTTGFALSFLIQLPWSNNFDRIQNFSAVLIFSLFAIIALIIRNEIKIVKDLREIEAMIFKGYEAVEFAKRSLTLLSQAS